MFFRKLIAYEVILRPAMRRITSRNLRRR